MVKVTLELHVNADAAIRAIQELTKSINDLSEKVDTVVTLTPALDVYLSSQFCGIDSVNDRVSEKLNATSKYR